MGIAATVLCSINAADVSSAVSMLGIGLACIGLSSLTGKNNKA